MVLLQAVQGPNPLISVDSPFSQYGLPGIIMLVLILALWFFWRWVKELVAEHKQDINEHKQDIKLMYEANIKVIKELTDQHASELKEVATQSIEAIQNNTNVLSNNTNVLSAMQTLLLTLNNRRD